VENPHGVLSSDIILIAIIIQLNSFHFY